MCRHLAYLGPPVTLEELLLTPDHSLLQQSYAPRFQRHGTVNADGFGVGWWQPDVRPEPARYRSSRPIWADASFASVAGAVRTGAVVAAVRSATPPLPVEETGCAPFGSGRWLGSHNGVVTGWSAGNGASLRARLSATRVAALEGVSDAEVLVSLALDLIDGGHDPANAIARIVRSVGSNPGGRLNLLLSDGDRIVATTWGDTLFTRVGENSITVASEPFGADGDWTEVPDLSLVAASARGLSITPLT